MNPHILFVMKWLDNPSQFTDAQVTANADAAYDDYWTSSSAATAAGSAFYDVTGAVCSDDTRYWVEQYFKLTGEDKQLYLDQIESDKERDK